MIGHKYTYLTSLKSHYPYFCRYLLNGLHKAHEKNIFEYKHKRTMCNVRVDR